MMNFYSGHRLKLEHNLTCNAECSIKSKVLSDQCSTVLPHLNISSHMDHSSTPLEIPLPGHSLTAFPVAHFLPLPPLLCPGFQTSPLHPQLCPSFSGPCAVTLLTLNGQYWNIAKSWNCLEKMVFQKHIGCFLTLPVKGTLCHCPNQQQQNSQFFSRPLPQQCTCERPRGFSLPALSCQSGRAGRHC